MSVNSKMTAIADKIRTLRGISGTMGLDTMATHIGNEQTAITAALAALVEKGVDVPAGSTSDALAGLIGAIESGGGATIATGSFKPSFSNPNHTVTHGLGVVPNFAICYRSMESLETAKTKSFVYLAKLNGVGTMVAAYDPDSLGNLYKKGNAGQDTTHAITDIPTDYAPYVGAYGATENEITFGHNYDSNRGDTYFCFEAGWDTFYWIVGVI